MQLAGKLSKTFLLFASGIELCHSRELQCGLTGEKTLQGMTHRLIFGLNVFRGRLIARRKKRQRFSETALNLRKCSYVAYWVIQLPEGILLIFPGALESFFFMIRAIHSTCSAT